MLALLFHWDSSKCGDNSTFKRGTLGALVQASGKILGFFCLYFLFSCSLSIYMIYLSFILLWECVAIEVLGATISSEWEKKRANTKQQRQKTVTTTTKSVCCHGLLYVYWCLIEGRKVNLAFSCWTAVLCSCKTRVIIFLVQRK